MADPQGIPVRTAWQNDVAFENPQDADRPGRYAVSHRMVLWSKILLLEHVLKIKFSCTCIKKIFAPKTMATLTTKYLNKHRC